MRVFIAVEPPADVRRNITALIAELKEVGAGVKWVAGDNLHLTLKFCGSVADDKVDRLAELTVKSVSGTGGFKAKFAATGTFPPGRSPRVVWVGVSEGSEQLAALAKKLGEAKFTPHVTIGRVKDQQGIEQLQYKLAGYKDPQFGEAEIDSVKIMKSTLTPTGPVYEMIKEVKL